MLSPPRPPRWGSLVRERLAARLDSALSHRLTLLIAPAGYGKTTLLGQWLSAPTTLQRYDVAWLTLDEAVGDPVYLFGALSQALAGFVPIEARPDLLELLAEPETSPRYGLTLLLNALSTRSRPLLLALDDVHILLDSREALALLEQLLTQAPAGLHLAFATRRELPLAAIPRLRAQGQVLDLDLADLRFTAQEVARLFTDVFEYPLSGEQADDLARRAEGWPVALSLVYQASQQAGADQAARLLRNFGGTAPQLYDYLATVVLGDQPEPLRHFLLGTSILGQLEPAVCNYVLGQEEAAAILSSLERRGLFTTALDAERSAYRYHALFREFLQRRLLETEGEATVRRLHRRAAALFLERGEDEQAVEHLLAAGDYATVVDMIRSLQARLFPTSRYHLMERWLERFPPAFAETRPWLVFLQAKLAWVRGQWVRTRDLYLRVESLFRAEGEEAGLYDVYHGLASAIRELGDFEQAVGYYRQALEYASTDVQRAVVLGQTARCLYMQGGQVTESMELLDRAVELAEASGDLLGRAGLLSLRGKMRSSIGDFAGALAASHTALDLLECYGNRHRQVSLLNNSAYHHCLLGQLDQAQPLAERALALAETFGRQYSLAYALNVLGEIHRRRREYDAARACYLEALSLQQQLGERYEIPVTFNWLGLLARQEGKLDEALRWGEEGLALREKLGTDYETGLSLIDVGATHLALGHLDRAGALWRRALDIFCAAEARYEQAQLHFYLAVLAQHRGNDEALARHLRRSFNLARAFEVGDPPTCLYFYVEETDWTVPVLVRALRLGVELDCARCLLMQLGPPAEQALLSLLDGEQAPVRARAARLLGCLASAAALEPLAALDGDPNPAVRGAAEAAIDAILASPPPPLRVRCLGDFCLWRDDEKVTRWGRSAARSVFQYLLAHRPQPVPMDLLMDAFWPDSGPSKARKSLHQAVAALRRALEPELAAGMPSRYLRVGDGTYALELPAGSWVDYEAFEARLRPFLDVPRPDPAAAEDLGQVLDLYGGDYLPEALYEEWSVVLRERLRTLYLSGLRLLAGLCLRADQPDVAADAVARALEVDPWDEEAVLLLMRAHEARGNLPAALRAYETLRQRLQHDLELPPRADLTALYRRLRSR